VCRPALSRHDSKIIWAAPVLHDRAVNFGAHPYPFPAAPLLSSAHTGTFENEMFIRILAVPLWKKRGYNENKGLQLSGGHSNKEASSWFES